MSEMAVIVQIEVAVISVQSYLFHIKCYIYSKRCLENKYIPSG